MVVAERKGKREKGMKSCNETRTLPFVVLCPIFASLLSLSLSLFRFHPLVFSTFSLVLLAR